MTGGSGGIGSAAVRQLAARGIETVFLYHRGTEAAAALTAETGMKGIRLDISDGGGVAQALSEEINACGGFDILVNAAGIAGFSLFQEIGDDAWQRMDRRQSFRRVLLLQGGTSLYDKAKVGENRQYFLHVGDHRERLRGAITAPPRRV